MKRFLCLGSCDLDVTFLEMGDNGRHVTQRQIVTVRLYREMPFGYTGPANGGTINAQFSPMSLTIEKGQWLTIVPESKMPPCRADIVLDF